MKILMRNQGNSKWNLVDANGYATETELQKLLAESPSLLSIEEIRPGVPPLVAAVREIGLPGSGYTDLIAFNQHGEIAIIECKLANNQEIKRKVIAQVLEYGAFLWTLSYDQLNDLIFRRTNQNLADLVALGAGDPSWDEESFRSIVEENLSSGKFILVIAVDQMNDELERTMRFLNTCGRPSFSFTVLEMQRFLREPTEILIPNLHGVVSPVGTGDEPKSHKQWTEEQFFEKTKAELPDEINAIIQDIYLWSKSKSDRVWFGVGVAKGSYTFHYLVNGKTLSIFSIYTDGTMIFNFGWLSRVTSNDQMKQFHKELVQISGLSQIPADFTKWPSIKIKNIFLGEPESLFQFKEIVEKFGRMVK